MQTEPIGFNTNDISFIENALNFYWNDAYTNLLRNDLGDIEKMNYEYQLVTSKLLMQRIDQNSNQFTASKKMAIALQKIEQHIDDSGLKMVDLENPLQVALYHIKHLSKEALKEAGL